MTNRCIILILFLFILACGQQTDKKEQIKNKPAQISTDGSIDGIVNAPSEKSDLAFIEKQKQLQFSNGPSRGKMELKEKTVIIIQNDDKEIDQMKVIEGEDNFYIAADDLMYLNSKMLDKMDSLKIPVKYSDKDTIDFYSTNLNQTIFKNRTFSLYTYFYYDGRELKRVALFELVGE